MTNLVSNQNDNNGCNASIESYHVAVLSTSHLTLKDAQFLSDSISSGEQMVLQRDTGFFIKLYPGSSRQNFRHGHSNYIKNIIKWALANNFQMIEFDSDGEILPLFPVFNW